MSEYMMMPGARLEIGPGGKPYESLGACCSSCARGGPCATGDAALSPPGMTPPNKGSFSSLFDSFKKQPQVDSGPTKPPAAAPPAARADNTKYFVAAAAVAGIAAFMYFRKK